MGSFYGKPNAPILMSNTDCIGNEQRLRDCQYTQLTEEDSTAKSSVAGITCSQPSKVKVTDPMTIGLIVMVLLTLLFLVSTIR